MNILIVEEEAGTSKKTRSLLNSIFNVEVTTEEAVDEIDTGKYDLILMDYSLPPSDIPRNIEGLDIPIVLLTDVDLPSILEVGFSDYIVKSPGYLSILPKIIQNNVESKRAGEIKRIKRELKTLNKIANVTTRSLNLKEIAEGTLKKVLEIMEMEKGVIHIVNEKKGEMKTVAQRGLSNSYLERFGSLKIGEYIPGKVAKSGKPVIITDASIDERATPDVIVMENCRTLISIPLKVKDKVVGVMSSLTSEKREINPRDLELFTTMGNQVGMAIYNASIYEESKLQEPHPDDLIRILSHDLKEPLRSIRTFSELLLEDYRVKLDDTGKDYLERLQNASIRMENLIGSLSMFLRIGRKKMELTTVDLNKLLEEIKNELSVTMKEKNAELKIESLPVIKCHRTLMEKLFKNLIDNGIKFNEEEKPIVKVKCEEHDNEYLFSIKDNGIGIKEKYLEKIFGIFEQIHPREKYKGIGNGLAICKKIVGMHGGKMWAESDAGKGSTFYFTIPKRIHSDERLNPSTFHEDIISRLSESRGYSLYY